MIKLELSLDEVNGILVALGKMPYAEVEHLVANIRAQAVPQVQPAPQPTQPAPAQ